MSRLSMGPARLRALGAALAWLAVTVFATPAVTALTLSRGGGWDYLLFFWLLVFSPSAGVAIAVFAALRAALRNPAFQTRHLAPIPAADLARVRIVAAAILLASTLWEHLPSTGYLPRELVEPMGVLKLLYAAPIGFERLAVSPVALGLFQATTASLLVLALLGWRSRATVPLAALCYTVLAGLLRQYAWFYHTGVIPLYVLWVLSITPCGDALSLDRRRRLRRGESRNDAPAAVYAWSRYACWVAIALPYCFAGASKLRNGGLAWISATNMKSIVLRDTLSPMEFDFTLAVALVDAPDLLFATLAAAAVASELLYPSVLFSRTARLFVPLATAALHAGILFFQNILFFDLILIQLVFWPPGAHDPVAADDGGAAGVWRPRILVIAAFLLFSWLALVEQYPFTAFQMYSGTGGSRIDYLRVSGSLASGGVTARPIEEAIPALRDSRYRQALNGCFSPASRPRCDALLGVAIERYNAQHEDPLEWIEVQRWSWDFEAAPSDPDQGDLLRRHRVAAATDTGPPAG